jgi:hypothetical protein
MYAHRQSIAGEPMGERALKASASAHADPMIDRRA